ncbi:acyl-CoA reductase-like NAD-dependent aldehyde dehydrogenase [Devosia subaequoris]|uniref:Acyl-CoA reductase-like NAD-dependent aldehyde dehydrogenase n=1 Tax=Devosia subaequoris TaxID=395930 RepID=A0A7W6IM12_9HYPH|nr:acyl-CoA reductase-like NAD-dependent aldehyde dehydrogenase [Devosia subaequoris]
MIRASETVGLNRGLASGPAAPVGGTKLSGLGERALSSAISNLGGIAVSW